MISVCECIAPIQKISAVFGLLLTRVVKENGKLTIQFSKLHILLPATYLVITTLLLYDLILTSPAVAKSKYGVGVMYIGMLFIFIGNITALYTITFTNAVVSAAIADVIDKISRIDELMKIMINKIDYKSHFKYEICMISSGLVIVLAEIILHFITFNAEQKLLNERLLFLFAFPVIIRIILEFQYVIFIKLLHERFALVNRELYNLFGYKSGSDKQYNMISVKTIQNCNWKGRYRLHKDLKDFFFKRAYLFKLFVSKFNNTHKTSRCFAGFSVWTNGESKCDTQLRSIQILMKLHDALTETGHKISRIFSLQILVCFAIHLICEVFIIFYASFEIVGTSYHNYQKNYFSKTKLLKLIQYVSRHFLGSSPLCIWFTLAWMVNYN